MRRPSCKSNRGVPLTKVYSCQGRCAHQFLIEPALGMLDESVSQAQHMAKKTAFRFFVADDDRCSLTWSLTIQKNDIYVSNSGSKHDKISLHESGSYQWSVRSEHQASVPFALNDRHIAKWISPSTPPGSLTRQFYVLIASTELECGRPRPYKKSTFLQAPGIGWATRVDFVVFTPPAGKQVTSATWEPKPIFEDRLASGKLLIVTQSTIPIDLHTATKFDAVRAMGKEEGEKHGKITARALAKVQDAQGIWGMAEVLVKRPSSERTASE